MQSFEKFNKVLFSMAIILFFFVDIHANTENCASIFQVTSIHLNVRRKAHISGKIIAILDKGDQVCISHENGNWVKISNGWVSKKYLVPFDNIIENPSESISFSKNPVSGKDRIFNATIFLGSLIVLAFILFGLKRLFYHTLINVGMAEPDGRSKNGIRLTRLGKFMASISFLIMIFIYLLVLTLLS